MHDMTLNYHLMHPGDDRSPGDPNAALYLNGVLAKKTIQSLPRELSVPADDMLRIKPLREPGLP